MRKALITSFAVAAALVVAATASGRTDAKTAAGAIPGCSPTSLKLVADGTLTIGADNPAFPPWFGGDEKTKPWKVSDPYSGKGYESAVAYAVAKQLGFTKAQVKWTVVPFNNSYRPGKKPFDFYITQVSYKPERAKAVDFSKGYYFVNQSLVARKGKPIASVRSIAGFKQYKLGAQIGTTSYDYIVNVIKPSSSPKVYDTNDAAVQALKAQLTQQETGNRSQEIARARLAAEAAQVTLDNARKDLRYYTHLAESLNAPSLVGEAVHQSLALASALGHGKGYVPSLVLAQEQITGARIVPR